MASRKKNVRTSGQSYEIRVVGAPRAFFGDWYHSFLRMPWSLTLALVAVAFTVLNGVFALAYLYVGGIAHARPGSFWDALNFSVQTLATIGYGSMYPATNGANALVLGESVVGLVFTALVTGLVFAKFARPIGRVAFSRHAVVTPMDGVPTLMFRVGNERGSTIVEAHATVVLSLTTKTAEGMTFYKLIDLMLVRGRSPAVARSWTVLHRIEGDSPLVGATPESLAKDDVELMVTLSGTDDTSYQPVHARHSYEHHAILWGARHADVLSETPEGDMVLDIRKFHDVLPTEATDAFPYRIRGASGPTRGDSGRA